MIRSSLRSTKLSLSLFLALPYNIFQRVQACAAIGSWSWARSLLLSARAGGKDRVLLTSKHYIHALSACAGVVGKPGGAEAQGAMKFALALIQDLRDAGWLKEQQGEDAYVLAMQTCVRAQDAWSALALLDNSEDDGIPEGPALRSAAMQVVRCSVARGTFAQETARASLARELYVEEESINATWNCVMHWTRF